MHEKVSLINLFPEFEHLDEGIERNRCKMPEKVSLINLFPEFKHLDERMERKRCKMPEKSVWQSNIFRNLEIFLLSSIFRRLICNHFTIVSITSLGVQ